MRHPKKFAPAETSGGATFNQVPPLTLRGYTKTIEPVTIPPRVKSRLLTETEKSELHHLNGEMGYEADTRQDAM